MSTNAPRENASSTAARKRPTNNDTLLGAWDLNLSAFSGFVVFMLITFAIYSPILGRGFGFIWDDDAMLWNNALMHARDGLTKIWFSTSQSDYFPLTYSSLWFEWHLWGMNAKGYHVVSLLLHGASTFVLWRALKALKIPGAFWAALLFAVHPVNVESVAWVAERKNTLSMFFFAVAALFYIRFENKCAKAAPIKLPNDYWLAMAAFVLALLAKTAVVMFPLVALGCAWWINGRLTKKDVMHSLPFFGASLLLGAMTIWFQYNRAISSEVVNASDLPTRLAIAGWNVWFYLGKALLPLKLTFVYPRWNIDWHNMVVYLPAIAVLACGAVLWALRTRWTRGPFVGFGYFVVMLFPVLGLLNIYYFRYSFVADHYQYFSVIAVTTLIAAGLMRWLQERGSFVLCLLAAGLAVLTWKQTHIYKNQETLWNDTLKKNPTCSMAESNWGYWLAETERKPEEAVPHYQAALELNPKDAGTHYNLGVALLGLNRVEEGVKQFYETLEIDPKNAFALQNLAWIEATTKHIPLRNAEHAVELSRRAVELSKGGDEWKLDTLAAALAATGKFEEAITTQEKALTIARAKNDAGIVSDMEQRLGLYRAHQPYKEAE